jgi:uncharacterized membrane protein/protein-disulfide isomerase
MSTIENRLSPRSPAQHLQKLSEAGRFSWDLKKSFRWLQARFLARPAGLSTTMAWIMMSIATIGLCLAVYLSWAALTASKVAGCGGSVFDCEHVMNTKWSRVMGMPVGIPAAAIYLLMMAALAVYLLSGRKQLRQAGLILLTISALAAGMAAIWFVSLQVFVVEHLCAYCLAAHACSLLLAGAVLWSTPLGLRKTMAWGLLSFCGIALLAATQVFAAAPPTYEIETYPNPTTAHPLESDKGLMHIPENAPQEFFSAPGFDSSENKPAEEPSNVFEAPTAANPYMRRSVNETDRSDATRSIAQMLFVACLRPESSMVMLLPPVEQQNDTQTGESDESDESSQAEAQERRLISISGGQVQLDVHQWPLVGNSDAELVIVEMFDYTCPHCRANHESVKGALDQLGDKVAMLALSVPMNRDCNDQVQRTEAIHAEACELSRLSVAVWRVAPDQFSDYHHWLFEGDATPTAAEARRKAESLVGKEALEKELASDVPGKYVAKQVQLYKMVGAGTVPKLLFPKSTLSGKVSSANSLVQIIKEQTSLR